MRKYIYFFISALTLNSLNVYSQTISAGTSHSAALCSGDSAVRAWGANSNGELGINDTTEQHSPVKVHGSGNVGFMKDVKQIVIRENFSLALKYDSTVWAWGYNGDGELGNNTMVDSWTPVQVHGPGNVGLLKGIIQISAGYAHALALKSDGTVWAWGDNTNGELGDNTMINDSTPIQVHGQLNVGFLTGVAKIAAGQQFNLALKAGGLVWSWGLDTNGELGDNSKVDKHVPVQVHGGGNIGFLSGITAFAAGGQHALALKSDSTIWSWGFNINGELGDNTINVDSVPEQVHGPGNVGFLTGAVDIKAGDYFSAIIKADSTIWAWGFNFYGQLGQNDTTQRNTPVHVHGPGNVGILKGITEIALGDEHLIAKKHDGTFWAFGWNGNGQIGDETTTDRWVPVMVNDPCSLTLGVLPVGATDKVNMYPNPATNQITFDAGKNFFSQLRIYNVMGQEVYSSSIQSNISQHAVNLSAFSAGVYMTQLTTETGIIYGKFIIQK